MRKISTLSSALTSLNSTPQSQMTPSILQSCIPQSHSKTLKSSSTPGNPYSLTKINNGKNEREIAVMMMGSYDEAEVCDLVGIYILNIIANKYDKNNIGLYRDHGLAAFKNTSGSKADKIKKDVNKIFRETDLRITIQANLKVVNFLDITLNLNNGKYYPYRKPNNKPVYMKKQSNHLPNIIKNLPDLISSQVSEISHDKEIFNQAAPSTKMHSNPVASRKTYITVTSNQKRVNVADSVTSYGSTHHSAKTYQQK